MNIQERNSPEQRKITDPVSKAEKRPFSMNLLLIGFPLILGVAVYFYAPQDMTESQRRMLSIFAIAMVLWATESIPLFATSLLIIVGEAWLIATPTNLDVSVDYKLIFGALSNPIIFIFLGGFIIAKAVQQEGIDEQMAALLMRPFGKTPAGILAGVMAITALFSMFMSNTATTAMMIILVQPLIAQIPEGDRFRRGLILSVPFAANIGGIGTPIGTPPNAIAIAQLERMGLEIGFAKWMICTIPLLVLALIGLWLTLLTVYRPHTKRLRVAVPKEFRLTFKAGVVYSTFFITVILWLTSQFHGIPTAVVAGLPIVALTTTGVIGRREFNRLDWDIIILIAGGIALGIGITSTHLDQWIVQLIPGGSVSFMWLCAVACAMVLALSTVMSNTVATNLLLPIALAIASASATPIQLRSLAILLAITSSFAMGLPVSTPPNAIAYGSGLISSRDILLVGGLISCIATAIIILTGPWVLAFILG